MKMNFTVNTDMELVEIKYYNGNHGHEYCLVVYEHYYYKYALEFTFFNNKITILCDNYEIHPEGFCCVINREVMFNYRIE